MAEKNQGAFAEAEDDDNEGSVTLPGDDTTPDPNEQNAREEDSESEAQGERVEERAREEKDDERGDERLAHEEEGSGEGDDADGEQEADDREHRPKRTSKERREARKRAQHLLRAENAHLQSQVQFLMQQMAALQTGQQDSRMATLDIEMNRCSDEIATAERVLAAAVEANNGADVVAAQRLLSEARAKRDQLGGDKERLAQALTQRPTPPPAPPAPGSAQANAREEKFRSDRPWLQFDPAGRPLNIESGVARTVSVALRAQGFDPQTPAYWKELDKRLQAAVPYMYESDDDEGDESDDEEEDEVQVRREKPKQQREQQRAAPKQERGPPVGRSGRNSQSNNETVVPKVVVDALKDAGLWDDPKERADALRYMREAGSLK